jgi:hypothetical protein
MKTLRLLTILLCTALTPAFAQSGPSFAEQKQACMGDALRLCSAYVPDRGAIANCLAAQRDRLSSQCRAIFEASAPSNLR